MVESEEKRKRLNDIITRWCENVKVSPYLRNGDIPSLVDWVLGEFYHITLCCGHLVKDIDEGVHIGFYTYEGRTDETTEGLYCKECAGKYIRTLGAWEIK